MKPFNKNKELKKLRIKQNKDTYIKRLSILISCFILLIGIIYFTFAKFESKQEYTLIQGKVVYGGSGDVNVIAIYKGTEKVDEIPAKGSGWYFSKAECDNDATASWNNVEWNLSINFTTKTKCNIYFVEATQTVVEYLTAKGPTDDTLLNDSTTNNNLRYVGKDPNNYVKFNNELWRIIGVMNNIKTESGETQSLVKIRRAELLGTYSWDTSSSTGNYNGGYGINQWGPSGTYEGADLMRELNYDYLGSVIVGTDGNWYSNNNNAKANAKPTSILSTSAQSMIESVVWNLGSPSNNNGSYDSSWSSNITPSTTYARERAATNGKVCSSGDYCNDSVTRTSTWTGKVGLIYPSDYGYATSGGTTTNRQTCLNTTMGSNGWENSSYSDCKNNDWLFNSSQWQWTLSPTAYSSDAHRVFRVYTSGTVSNYRAPFSGGVAPVVFLKSSISITGGDGQSTSPYLIG